MRQRWLQRGRSKTRPGAEGDRLGRLAAAIEALAEKDERMHRHTSEVADLRQRAALELHQVCADFTHTVNGLLGRDELVIDPPDYTADAFTENGANLIQISVRGRILQIEFEASPQLVSTENFRIPYTLEGSIRSFNQEWLERDTVDEQLIFYCREKQRFHWRFFDARTYRSGPLDRDYLVFLMERLI